MLGAHLCLAAAHEAGRADRTAVRAFGHAAIAAFLIDQGADIHAVARNAMQIQPLHAAVAGQYADIVRLLIEHGADVNARQQSGFTPLMAARQNNNKEIETLLLEAGAVA